jgi:hypothetical protein
MIRRIETPVSWIASISRPAHVGCRVAGYPPVQCVVSYVEVISFALIRQRVLSIIALCSIVWLASIWLAAADAQAQESPSNEASLSATEPAFVQRSLERTQGPHLLLTMVARSDRELGALRTSAIQSIGPNPTPRNAGEARLPSNPRGAEFASLAALASAPPSSLLYSIKTKGPGQANISSVSNDNSALVYRVGTINFVINRLPNNFSVSSVSSLGNSLSDARR